MFQFVNHPETTRWDTINNVCTDFKYSPVERLASAILLLMAIGMWIRGCAVMWSFRRNAKSLNDAPAPSKKSGLTTVAPMKSTNLPTDAAIAHRKHSSFHSVHRSVSVARRTSLPIILVLIQINITITTLFLLVIVLFAFSGPPSGQISTNTIANFDTGMSTILSIAIFWRAWSNHQRKQTKSRSVDVRVPHLRSAR